MGDQRAICDKVEYAIDNDLNGFIIWEITGDVREDLSTPLLDEVNMKLDFPKTHNCGGPNSNNALINENLNNEGSYNAEEEEGESESDDCSSVMNNFWMRIIIFICFYFIYL